MKAFILVFTYLTTEKLLTAVKIRLPIVIFIVRNCQNISRSYQISDHCLFNGEANIIFSFDNCSCQNTSNCQPGNNFDYHNH